MLTDISNIPLNATSKRACTAKTGEKIENILKVKAIRGRHASAPPPECPPPECPPPECPPSRPSRKKSKCTTYNEQMTLCHIIKHSPHIITEGMHTLQTRTERNTSFVTQKAVALQMFGACISTGMGILEACKLAGLATGFSDQSIRKWAQEIYADFFGILSSLEDLTDKRLDDELESGRGKHPKWLSLIQDENFRCDLRNLVVEKGYVKGRPNLTLQDVITWLKEKYEVDVCKTTVCAWLHEMGFSYQQHTKGVYFDGHERDDVVASRRSYLNTLQSYENRMWVYTSPCPDPAIHPILRIYHDESTYYSNSDQSFHWTDGTKQILKQKSLGQAIMVSHFIEEVGGLLECDGETAALLMEHQTEGYFTNDHLISQV